MQKIGGAIKWVDHPNVVGITLLAALLGEDLMVGIMLEDRADDGVFGLSVFCSTFILSSFGSMRMSVSPPL